MAKIQNISKIHPTLGFPEFDILEKYRKSFNESELGRLHSVFPFERMAKATGLLEQRLGRRNIHYQMFCGIRPVLQQEKKKEGLKDKDAQAPYDQAS